MTEETPERPPVRPTIRDVLAADAPVDDATLVATVAEQTGASEFLVNTTVKRMEKTGEIYNVTGDESNQRWKPTRP